MTIFLKKLKKYSFSKFSKPFNEILNFVWKFWNVFFMYSFFVKWDKFFWKILKSFEKVNYFTKTFENWKKKLKIHQNIEIFKKIISFQIISINKSLNFKFLSKKKIHLLKIFIWFNSFQFISILFNLFQKFRWNAKKIFQFFSIYFRNFAEMEK